MRDKVAEKIEEIRKLRKRLLSWHYKKCRGTQIMDLLESDYQVFRWKVCHRLEKELNFMEAIKQANEEELYELENIKTEKRLGI